MMASPHARSAIPVFCRAPCYTASRRAAAYRAQKMRTCRSTVMVRRVRVRRLYASMLQALMLCASCAAQRVSFLFTRSVVMHARQQAYKQ